MEGFSKESMQDWKKSMEELLQLISKEFLKNLRINFEGIPGQMSVKNLIFQEYLNRFLKELIEDFFNELIRKFVRNPWKILWKSTWRKLWRYFHNSFFLWKLYYYFSKKCPTKLKKINTGRFSKGILKKKFLEKSIN